LLQVLDYSQYYLDLTAANQVHAQRRSEEAEDDEETQVEVEGPEWSVLYNLTDYYEIQRGSAQELHNLAETFNTPLGLWLFVRYSKSV
jgi:hypothetical protein